MKKTKILCSVMIACLLQVPSFAQNDNHNEYEDNDNRKKYEFVKTKTVNKTYSVAARDKFSLRNSFGKVEVHTWNKNEVKVDVTVEVTANKEAVAQKIFDGISISEKQSGGEVSFKTNMKGSTNSKSDKSSMSVDYVIYLPETNELDVSNEFGATVIPNFKGKVDLTSKFGSLTTGNLADVKNILVEFGKGNFESINNGDITIKFSAANLGKLTGSTKLKFEFCSASRVNLDNNLSSLDLNASYSTINLKPANGLGAAYTIYTNFGTFKNKTAVKFDSDEDESEKGPKFDYTYTGKAGSGAIPIKVKTSFGKIILGEASEKELEEGEKKKSKKKTT